MKTFIKNNTTNICALMGFLLWGFIVGAWSNPYFLIPIVICLFIIFVTVILHFDKSKEKNESKDRN